MPSLEEIFSDGAEHFTRFFRRMALRSRLRNEEGALVADCAALGSYAWISHQDMCLQTDAAQRLLELDGKDAALTDSYQEKLEKLTIALDEERKQRKEATAGEDADGLDALTEKTKALIEEISSLEADIEQLQAQRDSGDAEDVEGIRKKIKSAQGKLYARRGALKKADSGMAEERSGVSRVRIAHQRFLARSAVIDKERKEIARERDNARRVLEDEKRGEFIALGQELFALKTLAAGLAPYLSKCELTSTTIETLGQSLESESRLLDLLDRAAVRWFYTICSVSGALIIVLISILLLL